MHYTCLRGPHEFELQDLAFKGQEGFRKLWSSDGYHQYGMGNMYHGNNQLIPEKKSLPNLKTCQVTFISSTSICSGYQR